MKYLKNKHLATLILFFAVITEYLHLLFVGEIHSYYIRNGIKTPIYWDDMIYYFLNETFILLIIILITIKYWTNSASKSIMSGLCIWYLIEWIEITLQLIKINDSRIYINDGSWLQLSTCLMIVLLVWFSNRKLTS